MNGHDPKRTVVQKVVSQNVNLVNHAFEELADNGAMRDIAGELYSGYSCGLCYVGEDYCSVEYDEYVEIPSIEYHNAKVEIFSLDSCSAETFGNRVDCNISQSIQMVDSGSVILGNNSHIRTANSHRSYQDTEYIPELSHFPRRESYNHCIGGFPAQLEASSWLAELSFENDMWLKSYIHRGILQGFDIVDDATEISGYDRSNYRSVLSGYAGQFVDQLIQKELSERKYIEVTRRPRCIHSLGVVPKKGGGFRPITDCSKPERYSINNYMNSSAPPFEYTTIDFVQSMFTPGCYSATVDISSAYRTVSVNPAHWELQGIRWKLNGVESFLLDTRLCFGLKCAPFVFSQLSNFIVRCLYRRGITGVINYLDDFICVGQTEKECRYVQRVLIHLLHYLGFAVAWKKCTSPSTNTRYLGILFDSLTMQISLPAEKLDSLYSELAFFENRTRATVRQIQRLCGILSHCSKVVRGGRTFSQRVIQLLKGLDGSKRIRLSTGFHADIRWWSSLVPWFNGSATMIDYNYGCGPCVFSDSSLEGYGLVICQGFFEMYTDWQAGFYDSQVGPFDWPLESDVHGHWKSVEKPLVVSRDDNINLLELIPIWLAILRLIPSHRNVHMVIFSDNTQVVNMLNQGKSSNVSCMCLLREIFWLCAFFNLYVTARHIPGKSNNLADELSRVGETGIRLLLNKWLLCCSDSGLARAGC